jgi:hypothetical protein
VSFRCVSLARIGRADGLVNGAWLARGGVHDLRWSRRDCARGCEIYDAKQHHYVLAFKIEKAHGEATILPSSQPTMTERTADQTPRLPTEQELRELTTWYSDLGPEYDEAARTVQCACIAVFDRYITDGPGYAGKLMSVVWGGSPESISVFTWDNGEMVADVHQ